MGATIKKRKMYEGFLEKVPILGTVPLLLCSLRVSPSRLLFPSPFTTRSLPLSHTLFVHFSAAQPLGEAYCCRRARAGGLPRRRGDHSPGREGRLFLHHRRRTLALPCSLLSLAGSLVLMPFFRAYCRARRRCRRSTSRARWRSLACIPLRISARLLSSPTGREPPP